MAKKTDKIKILFCGTNADDVTGSCVYIETPHRKILLECGLFQTCGSKLDAWKVNSRKFEFKAKDIDYVFLGHLHADHSSRVPLLFARGTDCPVICPENSRSILDIMWHDSAHIIEADAAELTKKSKSGRTFTPYYDNFDADEALEHVDEYESGEIHVLDEYVKFRFVPSGHIVGACQLELWITEGNTTKKVLYTSDLGNTHIPKDYVEPLEPVNQANIVISESTYAGQDIIADTKMREKDLEKLHSVIEQTCISEGHRILVPIFALDRLQTIMTVLYDMYSDDPLFNIPIYVDTPMGGRICQTYSEILTGPALEKWERVKQWKKFYFVGDYIESREIRDARKPCIVLSSSGFLVAGRSLAWCASMIERSQDRIVTVGYAPPGSLAYTIKNATRKSVKISGKTCRNLCQVTNLGSFSSHIQQDSLMDYLSSIQCEKIYLVHGEMDGKLSFAEKLKDAISKKNNTSKVVCVQKDMEISL